MAKSDKLIVKNPKGGVDENDKNNRRSRRRKKHFNRRTPGSQSKFQKHQLRRLLEKVCQRPRHQLHLCHRKDCRAANKLFKNFLKKHEREDCLILIDEHLEIKNWENLALAYKDEKTSGIIFLKLEPREIALRRQKDQSRYRHQQSLQKIQVEQKLVEQAAVKIVKKLAIPILTLENPYLEHNIRSALIFIHKIMGGLSL